MAGFSALLLGAERLPPSNLRFLSPFSFSCLLYFFSGLIAWGTVFLSFACAGGIKHGRFAAQIARVEAAATAPLLPPRCPRRPTGSNGCPAPGLSGGRVGGVKPRAPSRYAMKRDGVASEAKKGPRRRGIVAKVSPYGARRPEDMPGCTRFKNGGRYTESAQRNPKTLARNKRLEQERRIEKRQMVLRLLPVRMPCGML